MKEITVIVKPGSKKGNMVQASLTGKLLVYVREQAAEGKANVAVIELLAKYFEVPKSSVHLISGRKSKQKFFEIRAQIN